MTDTNAAPLSIKPNLKPFTRHAERSKDRIALDRVASWISQDIDAKVDPACLTFTALRRMDNDPIVYLAEWAITGLIRKPDLYHVTHPTDDKKVVAETEDWLWPLMEGGLLAILARSFVYGAIPFVLDLEQGSVAVRVPNDAGGYRKRTLPDDHLRYTAVHELRPDRVTLEVDARNRLLSMTDTTTGRVYDPGVARVAVWDRQFGEWTGQAARRRAWPAYAKARVFELLQAKYLERSVHAPLVIYAQGKDVTGPEGQDLPMGEYIATQLELLMGGGYMTMPGDQDGTGKRLNEVFPLTLPERSEVFERSLDRFDGQVLASYLVPPAMSMIEDTIGGGAARVLRDMFSTFVEGLVSHVARELGLIVNVVHALNYDRKKDMAPEVKAAQIPEKVQKLYLDVLAKVGEAARLGERVDVDQLLDYLEVPRRSDVLPPDPNAPPVPGEPGPDRDPMGEREKRREDAKTPEGEEDTGAPRDEDGNPTKVPA
jgi:hypothetical protein